MITVCHVAVVTLLSLQLSKIAFGNPWQCQAPTTSALLEVIPGQMKSIFDVIGFPSWTRKPGVYVSCEKRGLTKMLDELESDLEILNLNYNMIRYISRTDFDPYPNITAIIFSNNCVYEDIYKTYNIPRCNGHLYFEPHALFHLKKLKYLDVSGNNLLKLPGYLPHSLRVIYSSYTSLKPIFSFELDYLTSLTVAMFSCNCIMGDPKHFCRGNFTIHGRAFTSMNLRYLDLSFNNWTHVPSYLFTANLKGIRIRGNPLHTVLKDDFHSTPNLTYLILSWASQYFNRRLVLQRGCMDRLKELQSLDLSGNMLETLPVNFLKHNKKLKSLNLRFNCFRLSVLNPTFLPSLPMLEDLDLSGNTICLSQVHHVKLKVDKLHLGDAFLNFPNLRLLFFGAIQYTTWLNVYMAYGTDFLQVDGQGLSVLKNLTFLQEINFSACGIVILEKSAWKQLNLTTVRLDLNQIGEAFEKTNKSTCTQTNFRTSFVDKLRTIPIEESIATPHKKNNKVSLASDNKLSLQNNAIFDLSVFGFSHTPLITHLDLSSNRINYIYNDTFSCLVQLKILDLRNNPIRRIHAGSLIKLNSLSKIYLENTAHTNSFALDFLNGGGSAIFMSFKSISSQVFLLLRNVIRYNLTFSRVQKIDFSDNPVPIYTLSKNQAMFKTFPNVQSLNLDNSQLHFPLGSNFFFGIPQTTSVSLKNNGMHVFPCIALHAIPKIIKLDLSHNFIEELVCNNVSGLTRLEKLIVSHNFISYLDPDFIAYLQRHRLVHLDLSFNRIADVGPKSISKSLLQSLEHLDLRGNMITCDCSLVDNFGWLVSSKNLKKGLSVPGFLPSCPDIMFEYYGGCLICQEVESQPLRTLYNYSTFYFCQLNLAKLCTSFFVTVFVVFIFLGMLLHNNSWNAWLIKIASSEIRQESFESFENVEGLPNLFSHHAFVFYDAENSFVGEWVEDRLVPAMEHGVPSLRLCVMGREDYCGTTRVKQLLLQMQSSNKTIVVISNKFDQNVKCKYVLSVLEDWIYSTGKDKVILLTFEQDPCTGSLIQRLQKRSLFSTMQIPSTERNYNVLWELLRTALLQI